MIVRVLKKAPLFALLLPFFFVLHGFAQYSEFIPTSLVVELLLRYFLAALLLFGIFLLLYRNREKAGMAVFASFFFFCFFGAFHDFLKQFLDGAFLTRYVFLLPLLVAIYVLLLVSIRRKRITSQLMVYLNAVLLVLLTIDAGKLFVKAAAESSRGLSFQACSRCEKPGVHLIVIDGYAGHEQLEKDFGFSNSFFLDSLKSLGFRVLAQSHSNYVRTEFSMASMLNMEYHRLNDYRVTDASLFYSYRKIAQNNLVHAFQEQGYEIVNNSIFDIENKPSPVRNTFLVTGTDLIQSETLLARLRRDVYIPFLMRYGKDTRFYNHFIFQALDSDKRIISRLKNLAKEKAEQPRFIYSHLLMTHFPYYFKANGQLNAKKEINAENYEDKELYLGNLQYTNHRILDLLNTLLHGAPNPPVIVLVSDHGFRYSADPENAFSTLGAVYLPRHSDSLFYDSISGVNQFRVLLNTLFRQQIPLLEDRNGEVPDTDQRE